MDVSKRTTSRLVYGAVVAAEGSMGVGSVLLVVPLLTWSTHWIPFQ